MGWPILDITKNDPMGHKDLTVESSVDGLVYSSILTNPKEKKDKWKWKWIEYPEETHSNAVKSFKFFVRDWKDKLKYTEKDAMKLINKLKKDLSKENIYLCYLDNMGTWYGGENHFIDYLWTDAENEIADKFGDTPKSYIITDDIYVLDFLRDGKMSFKHSILKEDIGKFENIMKKYIKRYKYNEDKSIDIAHI